jgi:hypothetical protein
MGGQLAELEQKAEHTTRVEKTTYISSNVQQFCFLARLLRQDRFIPGDCELLCFLVAEAGLVAPGFVEFRIGYCFETQIAKLGRVGHFRDVASFTNRGFGIRIDDT